MKSSRKKILVIASFPFPWLSVPLLYNLLPRLAQNHDVYVINRGDANTWHGVNFINFGRLNQLKFIFKLNSWLKKNLQNYDEVFIYNDYNLVLSTFYILKRANKKIHYIFESKWFIKIKDMISPLYINCLNSNYYKTIFVLDELLLNYLKERGLTNKNVILLSTGVNKEYFKPSPIPNNRHIVYVGNLSKRRELKVMLDSFEIIRRYFKDSKLIIVGEGNDRQSLVKYASQLKLSDHIVFTGAIDHSKVYEYIKQASICFAAYPKSKFDIQLPYKLLEYLACYRPVITTNTTAVKYYFKDQEHLLMCDYTAEAIAKNLKLLMENRQLQEKLAAHGYKQSKTFSWDKVEKIFSKVLNG